MGVSAHSPGGGVGVGSTVTLGMVGDAGDEVYNGAIKFTVVDEAYADRFRGRISERSTVARSVMGRHVGEEVRVPIGPAVEPAAEEAGSEEAGVHFRVLAVSG